ncbi:MAG: hypothetical protein KF721_14820 [Ignavibacteriaceae bacterium]|nr:hypothetical protein [Ignavibacteriaceae bacterium]
MKTLISFVLLFIVTTNISFSQIESDDSDSVEVFILDSYIPLEKPNSFFISFLTDVEAKTSILINDKYSIVISANFSENHKAELDLSNYEFDSSYFYYWVIVEGTDGRKNISEVFVVDLPMELRVKSSSNVFTTCLLGGVIFATPSPQIIFADGKRYFGITKELPVLAKFAGGYNLPVSYFSIEFSHTPKLSTKNLFRIGYKQIYEVPYLQFFMVGLNGFTNFNSFNGVSPEISVGLFRFSNIFTVYSKYRYNLKPNDPTFRFSEVSLGLFSSSFTIQF